MSRFSQYNAALTKPAAGPDSSNMRSGSGSIGVVAASNASAMPAAPSSFPDSAARRATSHPGMKAAKPWAGRNSSTAFVGAQGAKRFRLSSPHLLRISRGQVFESLFIDLQFLPLGPALTLFFFLDVRHGYFLVVGGFRYKSL